MEILGIGAEKYSSIDIYDWQRWLIELDLSSIISGLNIHTSLVPPISRSRAHGGYSDVGNVWLV
jgi:hypothetical protein